MESGRRFNLNMRPALRSSMHRRGFSLIELMVSTGISSVIALVTGGIIVNAVKTMRSAGNNGEASSVVNNIRTELADFGYSKQVVPGANGQATTLGCKNSFAFDSSNNTPMSTILADLKTGACVPAKVFLTRSSANPNTFISADAGSDTENSAQGSTSIQSLEYCNAAFVGADATQTTYTGELYITQSLSNKTNLNGMVGSLANVVMGASYGARQFVSRLVVGVDTNGNITSCNAPANSQVNGQNCTGAGMYYDPNTQRCENYPVGLSTPALSTCTPVTQTMQLNGQAVVCHDSATGCQSGYFAGGYHDGILDCSRRTSDLVATSNPALQIASGPSDQNDAVMQTVVPNTNGPNGSGPMPQIPSATGQSTPSMATSTTVPLACQSAVTNYLQCLTALHRLKVNLINEPFITLPDCTYLKNTVCTSIATTAPSAGASGAVMASSMPSIPSGDCICGTQADGVTPYHIKQGEYCGWCSTGVDTGYGTVQNASEVEQCDPMNTGSGQLVPIQGAVVDMNVKCQYDPVSGLNTPIVRQKVVPRSAGHFQIP